MALSTAFGRWAAAVPGLAAAAILYATPALADGPFAGYAGRWVGNGSVTNSVFPSRTLRTSR